MIQNTAKYSTCNKLLFEKFSLAETSNAELDSASAVVRETLKQVQGDEMHTELNSHSCSLTFDTRGHIQYSKPMESYEKLKSLLKEIGRW